MANSHERGARVDTPVGRGRVGGIGGRMNIWTPRRKRAGPDGSGLGRISRAMASLGASPKSLRRLLCGFAAGVVVATWGTVGYIVHDARQTSYADARAELLGAQHVMRAHAERTLGIGQIFLVTLEAWLDNASRMHSDVEFAGIAEVVDRLRGLDPERARIQLFDGAGRLLDPAGRPTVRRAGDAEYLDVLRDAPPGTLHLGLPVPGPATESDFLPLALKARPNRFGVAVVSVEIGVAQFRRTYANFLISAPAVYGILRTDSRSLFHTPQPPPGYEASISRIDFDRLRRASGPINVLEHERLDGSPGRRLSGYAFLDRYPAVIYASFLKSDIDERWRDSLAGGTAFGGFITLVVALLTVTALALLARYTAEAERVRRALAEAEAASSAKSSFMGRMSHEFRTPLNAILGFSEVIRDGYLGPLPEVYREYGADIQRSGRHLLGLVDQILDIAVIEAQSASPEDSVFDLAGAVVEAAEMSGPAAVERGIELRVDAGPGVRLSADRRMVVQSVLVVLSNAVKFSPAGERVAVGVRLDGDAARIVVADRGPGIPERVREHLFEPFGRDQAYIAADRQGLGLGLLIARSYMEIHGGTIAIEARPGGGTVVELGFPPARLAPA